MQLPANDKPENLTLYCMSSAESLQFIEGEQLLAQVHIDRSVLENLIIKVPDEIPDSLRKIHSDSIYDDKLINHPLF